MVLINSNPATIMTDPEMADRTYIEPITPEMVCQISSSGSTPTPSSPPWGARQGSTAVAVADTGILEKLGWR